MIGTIVDFFIDGHYPILLVQSDETGKIVNKLIEPRYMDRIIEGENIRSKEDLVGRKVELFDESIRFLGDGEENES